MTIDLESALFDEDAADERGALPVISDPGHADRILRRIDRLRRDAVEVARFAESEIQRIEAWRDERLEVLAAAEAREVQRVTSYHQMLLAQDPSALTVSLPNGALRSRAQQPEWIFDDSAFIAWAIENLPAVIAPPPPPPPPSIDKVAAKKALTHEVAIGGKARRVFGVTETGERPPGVRVEERDRKHDVAVETARPKELDKAAERLAALSDGSGI